jgi:hypothetical protein
MESSHACRGRSTTWRKDVADMNVSDQCGVKVYFRVGSLEDGRENFFRASILEATFLAL